MAFTEVEILYTNHRGETSIRHIEPILIRWGRPISARGLGLVLTPTIVKGAKEAA